MSPTQGPVVAVFGSYRPKLGDPEYQEAREVGRLIAERDWTVINGGYAGVMEASARGAKDAGGRVIGVTVETYSRVPNDFTDESHHTQDLWERLRTLINRSDAYIAMPGATGTLAEVALVWELMAKRLMRRKPLVLLGKFWRPLYNMMIPDAEAKAACAGLVQIAATPREAVDFVASILEQ